MNKILLASLLLSLVPFAYADKLGNQITQVISSIDSTKQLNQTKLLQSSPNSSVLLDFSVSVGESWDIKDRPINMVSNCITGTAITGFEYTNIKIQTYSGSYFSEAVLYFTDSNKGDDGIGLVAGAGDESSGTSFFSSDGILDITDSGNVDVLSQGDNKFIIQFYETIDDTPNAIDARFTGGLLKVWGVDLSLTNECQFVVAAGEADLSIDYEVNESASREIGDQLIIDLTISNAGSVKATNIIIDSVLSSKLQLIDMSCDDGTLTENFNEVSSLGVLDISSAGSLLCSITTAIIGYGSIDYSVSVSADNDSNVSNNTTFFSIDGAFSAASQVPSSGLISLLLLILLLVVVAKRSVKFN